MSVDWLWSSFILGEPGAASREDGMFVVKVYFKNRKIPRALTLTEPVPEGFEFPASGWPQCFFVWPISEEEQPGDSDVLLHEVVSLIDRQTTELRSAFNWESFSRKISERNG